MPEPTLEHESPAPQEAPATPEFSREELIAELTNLEIPQHAVTAKVDLMLVYLGVKSASEWQYTSASRRPGRDERVQSREPFDQVVAWADKTGLAMEVEEGTVNPFAEHFNGEMGDRLRADLSAKGRLAEAEALAANPDYSADQHTLFLAQDPVHLAQIVAAKHDGDSRRFGEAVGFPPTAVEAYMDDAMISPQSLAGKVPDEILAFADYGLSAEHTAQDLGTAERWSAAMQMAASELFEQKIAQFKQPGRAS